MPDIKLKEGKKISIDPFEFKVFLTPGHSPGHICLYEPNRKLLFTGDHILPEITPHIGFHPQSGENPLGAYLKSLEKMMKDFEIKQKQLELKEQEINNKLTQDNSNNG